MAPPKRPWFRFYTEMIWDSKIRGLTPTCRWLWVSLLSISRQSPVPGTILITESVPMETRQIADAAGLRESDVKRGLSQLSALGLIEWNGLTWLVPKWKERQYDSDSSTDRTAKHRSNGSVMERPKNAPETETEETETETETETDKPRARARATSMKEDWKPTHALIEWAADKFPSVDIVNETEKFRDYFIATGKPLKDWEAAWRNWFRRSDEFRAVPR